MRNLSFWVVALLATSSFAAERTFNLSGYPLDETPPGFRSTVAGIGKPGDWKVILDEIPQSLASGAPNVTKRAVLAQLARDPSANHFPLLIFDKEKFGDFKLTTRLKITGGAAEQIAGIVFRFQSETNYLVAAANVLRSNLCCYRIVQGEIAPLFGRKTTVAAGEWHTLGLQSEGNRVLFSVDDNEPIKLLVDGPQMGQIGFWTKSDSVVYFADTRISYTPREILAQTLVRDAMVEYPRLLGLKIFAVPASGGASSIVASVEGKDMGQAGSDVEQDVITRGTAYYSRDKKSVTVTSPLRDRNGDPIAAVRVVMKSFPGQTEDNAVVRAQPVVKYIQARVHSLEELLQ